MHFSTTIPLEDIRGPLNQGGIHTMSGLANGHYAGSTMLPYL
jgi:hypothetical protein